MNIRVTFVLISFFIASPLAVPNASTADICALLTRNEATKALGAPVDVGEVAGPLGSACQWKKTGGDGHVQVQVVRPRDWSPPKRAAEYRKLPGIGRDAYTIEELGAFVAAAVTDKNLVAVNIRGGTATTDTAVALLKIILSRVE